MPNIPIDQILSLIKMVVQMAMNVKANKERCQRVGKQVESLQELVLKLKERDPRDLSEIVRNALNELSATLVNAQNVMQKYSQSNPVKSFVFNSAQEDKFHKINERLDDTFKILTGALQIEQGETLLKVLNAVTEKRNEIAPPRQPCPIGFSNMCMSSHLPGPPMPIPTPNVTPTSPPPTIPPQSPMSPTPTPDMPKTVPAISVTPAPNPPYPPAQRPAYNPNALSVPPICAPVPCSMPPRLAPGPPPAYMRPVMTMQGVYGTLPPRPMATLTNTIVRAAPPVRYVQAMPPQQMIVTVPQYQQVLTNPGVVTVVMTRQW